MAVTALDEDEERQEDHCRDQAAEHQRAAPPLNAALALFRRILDSSGTVEPARRTSSFDAVMSRLGPPSRIVPVQCSLIPSAEQAAFRFSSSILILDDIIVDYDIPMQFEKTDKGNVAVALFVAYAKTEDKYKVLDEDELNDIKWFSLDEARKVLNNVKNRKELLESTITRIKK